MKSNAFLRYLTISLLVAGGIQFEPARATLTTTKSTQAVDLKVAIDRFFKDGTLEETWFAPMKADGFSKFRQQALGSRQLALKRYGNYKSVRNEEDRYIVTFAKGKITLVFRLNERGQIASVGIK